MQPDHEDSVQVNKRHWDVWARRDWPYKTERLKLIKESGQYLEEFEPKLAPYLQDIKGKNVIVLQFGDGLVMLTCAKRGATVTGVDLSAEQIKMAKEAAAYCDVAVDLIEADCQNLPATVQSDHFDFAVAECGIFCWIQNPKTWMRSAYRVLKYGGILALSDFHGVSQVAEENEGRVTFRKSYFDQGPQTRTHENHVPPSIEFVWKLSDIINAAIQAGFKIDRVEEFYWEKEGTKAPLLPTDYLLVATKE